MTEYRCHFLIGDRVQGVTMFKCHSDAEMVVHANDLLDSDTQCDAVEVWAEARLVVRLPRGAAAKKAG
jgi:hypothetical protein